MSNQPIRINVGKPPKYTNPSIVVNNVVKPYYVTNTAFQQLVEVVEDIPNKYLQKSELNSKISQYLQGNNIVVYNSDENCLEVL